MRRSADPFGSRTSDTLRGMSWIATSRTALTRPDPEFLQLAHMPCRIRHGNTGVSVLADHDDLMKLRVHGSQTAVANGTWGDGPVFAGSINVRHTWQSNDAQQMNKAEP
jgi:hypothetical protein